MVRSTSMERREFVAGVGGLASALVPEVERRGSAEVVARETVRDGTKIPAEFDEGDRVSVEVNVLEGSVSVAVMSLSSMTRKKVTGRGEVVAEIDEDNEYLVDVTGDGRAEVSVFRM